MELKYGDTYYFKDSEGQIRKATFVGDDYDMRVLKIFKVSKDRYELIEK